MGIGKRIGKSGDLNRAGVVPEVEEGEAAMDPVEGDPPAKRDPFAHIGGGQLAAEACSGDPLERGRGNWGLGIGNGCGGRGGGGGRRRRRRENGGVFGKWFREGGFENKEGVG